MPGATLRVVCVALFVALAGRDTCAYPLYVSANGTALLRSAYGGDVVLRPDAGGAIVASSVLQAQGGVALNNTLLAESTITTLQSQVSSLQAATGQFANLSDLVAEYASVAPVQLSGPPDCGPPGGDRLQYVNGSWICVCTYGWTGRDCSVLYVLYDIGDSFKLDTCGMTSYTGPSMSACVAHYIANSEWITDASVYSFGYPPNATNIAAWQKLILPQTGVYNITVAGASAGSWTDRSRGAVVSISISLPINTTLYIMVGQQSGGGACSGGGGGSFVILGNGTILAVAGGGGGQSFSPATIYPGSDASLTSTSGNPSSDGNLGGVDGNGGAGGATWGCGGGGIYGNGSYGVASYPSSSTLVGIAAVSGGSGHMNRLNSGYSGFGGGGSTHGNCGGAGGGGGYSGGGGSNDPDYYTTIGAGGGGGSYCIYDLSNCETAYNVGAGYVTIELVEAYLPPAEIANQTGSASSGVPLVTSLSALATQLADLAVVPNISALVAEYASLAPVQLSGPPDCGPPGGDRLQYVNGRWICVCLPNWLTTLDDGVDVATVTTACAISSIGTQYYGTASQFSAGNPYGAANANDNNTSCDDPSGSGVAVSGYLNAPTNNWWQLDIGTVRTVSQVALYGRRSYYTAEFADLQVYVSSVPSVVGQAAALANASFCNTQTVTARAVDAPPETGPTVVVCGPTFVGRYVGVYQTTGTYLSLCEVSVFGYATNSTSLAQVAANISSSAPLVTSLSALATQLAAQQAELSTLQSRVTQLFSILNAFPSSSTDGYGNASVSSSEPPACMPPGGDRLLYNGTAWVCVCLPGWTGVSCLVPPSPPSPPPSPPPPSPPSPPLPPFPPSIGCVIVGSNGSCLFESSSTAIVLDEVSSISAVCVGGGGSSDCNIACAGGGGGGLSWISSIRVSKGTSVAVGVGVGGILNGGNNHGGPGRNPGGVSNITVNGSLVLLAQGGAPAYMDTGGAGGIESALPNSTSYAGGAGGSYGGGLYGWPGGGGAAGYAGNGGAGGSTQSDGSNGSGGGGGGGEGHYYGSYGGGVGLFGEGTSGHGGTCATACGQPTGNGGNGSVQYGTLAYGGGGCCGGNGYSGACRIIWGNGCTYPTNAGPDCFQAGLI